MTCSVPEGVESYEGSRRIVIRIMSTRSLFLGILLILAAGTAAWLYLRPDVPLLPNASSEDPPPPAAEGLTSARPDSMIVEGDRARPAETPATMDVLEPGDAAPNFTLASLRGARFELAEHRGEVVVLNFFATWCEPCHEEMPDLQMTYDSLAGAGVSVVGISIDDEIGGREAVARFQNAYPVDFPLLLNGVDVARRYGAHYVVPTTYVVDRDGRVADRLLGSVTYTDLVARLRSHL